jgi:hypothetical protein
MRSTLIGTNEKKSRACRGWKNYLIVGTIEKTNRQRVAHARLLGSRLVKIACYDSSQIIKHA